MNAWCLANYIGLFNARILEELGYRTKEAILNANVFDLIQIGSFSIFDVEDLILVFAKEARPKLADKLDGLYDNYDDVDDLSEVKDSIKIYGLTRNDRPNKKVKSLTVNDVIRFRVLSWEKIEVLLEILENGMMRDEDEIDLLPYFDTLD